MSRRKKLPKLPKVYVRPIGDGDSLVYIVDKEGNEIPLDTPIFEEYGDEMVWCYENGYEPIYGE